MISASDSAEKLYKFIYMACFSGQTENLGGHHGMNGMMRGLREDLMRETGVFCGKLKSNTVSSKDLDNYIGICRTATVTGVFSESDLNKVIEIIEG